MHLEKAKPRIERDRDDSCEDKPLLPQHDETISCNNSSTKSEPVLREIAANCIDDNHKKLIKDVHADGLKYDEEVEDEPSKMIKDQSPSQTHDSRILGSSNVPSSYPDNGVSDNVPSSDDAIHGDDVDKEAGPEGKWCWVVLVASFMTLMVLDGVNYSFGVMMEPLTQEMGGGNEEIAMAGSLQLTVYCFAGLLAAKLTTRFGTRLVCGAGNLVAALGFILASLSRNLPTLLLTYGVIVGVGFGLMYIPAIVAVAQHFTARRSLALGICVCGTGLGTFLFAPLETIILEHLGWRWTMVVLSCVSLSCLVLSSTMCPVKQEDMTENNQDSANAASGDSVVIRPKSCVQTIGCFLVGDDLYFHPNVSTFILVVVADFVGSVGLFVPFIYLPELAEASGISEEESAWLVSGIGISSSIGRISSGWIDDQSWSNPIALTASALLVGSLQPFLITWSTSYTLLMIFSCMYGLMTGVWIAAASPMLLSVLGLQLLTPAFGLMTALQGVSALLGSPLAGLLVDNLGSPKVALIFAGVLLFVGAILFFISFYHEKRLRIRRGYQQLL